MTNSSSAIFDQVNNSMESVGGIDDIDFDDEEENTSNITRNDLNETLPEEYSDLSNFGLDSMDDIGNIDDI